MYIMSGELMRYHEERVKLLTRQYQDSKWQQAQFWSQISALAGRIRSWFDRDVESVPGVDSRLEPQTIQVERS